MQELRKLLGYLKAYKKLVGLSALCHILMALFTVISIPLIIPFFQVLFSKTPTVKTAPEHWYDIIAYLEYYFVDIIQQHGTQRALLIVCLLIMMTFFLKNLFRYLAMFFMVPVRSSIVERLRTQLYEQYLQTEIQDNKFANRGDLISRIISDVQEVEWSILRFVDAVFKSPIVIIGSVLFMVSINIRLSLFVLILMLFTAIVIGTLSKTLKKQSRDLQQNLAGMTTIVDETLDGNLLINIFRVKSFWITRFSTLNSRFRTVLNRVTWRRDLSSPLSEFMGVSVVVVLLWYGSRMVLNQEIAAEVFFAFIFAFYNVIEPSKSFSTAFYNIQKGVAALERIQSVIAIEPAFAQAKENRPFSFNHKLSFQEISFSYDNQKVLDQLSFSIKKGEKIAIVGPSGAGKSTLVMLLLKNLSPQSGHILLDDTPLSVIDRQSLYQNVGIVTQHPFLFNDTIYNNITLGRQGITEAQMSQALSKAQLQEFVSHLPKGMDTIIGDRGESLSGGEKQRLTIARALLEDPELLILDEPTSALDPESEQGISNAIIDALKDRTAIIIAHRLSTIKYADRILVLNDGRIVEDGNHNELLALRGMYADYVRLQSIN
jgi:subfamily B ATP-binding cassette protein MsbA